MSMTRAKRVVLAGSFRVGRLAASYQRAFEMLGHEVIRFDVDSHHQDLRWWLRSRIGHRLSINSLSARRMGAGAYNKALYHLVADAKPCLVLAFNGPFIMPETVRMVRQQGAKFVLFHADNPLPPNYNARPETLLAGKECDAFLVWSSALAKQLRGMGIPAGFLAFGWDDQVTPFQGAQNRLDCDVAFVGGWDQKRERFLEEVARHFNLQIWGPPYWGQRTRPGGKVRQCWQGRELRGAEVAEAFARTRINLNILRDQHYIAGKADGVIMRTFEVPGAGGFLLATRSGDATELFPENESVGYFDDLDECLERIEHYLTHDAVRNEASRQAHSLVDAHHHYSHRVKDLLEKIA